MIRRANDKVSVRQDAGCRGGVYFVRVVGDDFGRQRDLSGPSGGEPRLQTVKYLISRPRLVFLQFGLFCGAEVVKLGTKDRFHGFPVRVGCLYAPYAFIRVVRVLNGRNRVGVFLRLYWGFVPPIQLRLGRLLSTFVMGVGRWLQVNDVSFENDRLLRQVLIPGPSYVAGHASSAFHARTNSYRCCRVFRLLVLLVLSALSLGDFVIRGWRVLSVGVPRVREGGVPLPLIGSFVGAGSICKWV